MQELDSQDDFAKDIPLALYLPCQLPSHPFGSQRLPTVSNLSLSKWACTELSTQDQKDISEQDRPEQELQMQDFFTNDLAEATFKPKELKEQLRSCTELRKMLRQTLEGNVEAEDAVKVKREEGRRDRVRGKTRYQKILDDFFKREQSTIKTKLDRVPSLKDKFAPSISVEKSRPKQHQVAKIANRQLRSYSQRPLDQKVPEKMMGRVNSQKEISCKNELYQAPICSSGRLPKTFSQQTLTHHRKSSGGNLRPKDEKTSEGWMKMTFTQRQERVLSNRTQKENIGKQLNLQKEIKECTFKPETRDYKPKAALAGGSSYARLYLDKVRRRL